MREKSSSEHSSVACRLGELRAMQLHLKVASNGPAFWEGCRSALKQCANRDFEKGFASTYIPAYCVCMYVIFFIPNEGFPNMVL